MQNSAQSHYKTLKSFRDSAEFSRASLPKLDEGARDNYYRVRMEGSDTWVECSTPPAEGAEEWLHMDKDGRPIYYWSKETKGLTLLG